MTAQPSGPEFSVRQIPFSLSGSWLSVSPVLRQHVYADDPHLISHRGGMHAVLGLVPLHADGTRAQTRVRATPSLLRWEHDAGDIELVFDGPDAVRVRGTGLGLRIAAAVPQLTPFTGLYFYADPADGGWTFTSYETGRRYRVTVLSGGAVSFGAEALDTAKRGVWVSGADGWEIVLEERVGVGVPFVAERSFDHAWRESADAFAEFADAVAPWRTAATPAAELACYVLWSATVRPQGFVTRPGVLMSKHWMNKVWSWDHCFNALALAPGAPELAWDQFSLLFDHQDDSGVLPDSVTHSEVLFNYVKPPIHGWALGHLRRLLPAPLPADRLAEVYERLARWTDFWLTCRRAPGDALPYYQHGNDSGWDNATTFDPERVVVSADLAGFLAVQMYELARLAGELDRPEEANRWTFAAEATRAELLGQLWTGDRFATRGVHTGATWTTDSLLDLMPIALGEHLPEPVATALAARLETHLTDHGLATELPTSPHYEPDGYWRGPIWAPATILIIDGLRRAGHDTLANRIAERFRNLCETSGFAENFDALTGAGLRDRAYTWTASAYLILAREHALGSAAQP